MVRAGELVQPLINLLRERLLAYDIVAMDETRLQVLKEPGKRAESQSYLWVQRGGPPDHPILLYDYDPSRSQQVPIRLFEGFSGYLLTDGYEAYGKVCAEYGLTAVGCWAHVRRKFDEAIKAQGLLGPEKRKASLAGAAMAMIQQLYRIEREIRPLSAEERQGILSLMRRIRMARPARGFSAETWNHLEVLAMHGATVLQHEEFGAGECGYGCWRFARQAGYTLGRHN